MKVEFVGPLLMSLRRSVLDPIAQYSKVARLFWKSPWLTVIVVALRTHMAPLPKVPMPPLVHSHKSQPSALVVDLQPLNFAQIASLAWPTTHSRLAVTVARISRLICSDPPSLNSKNPVVA